jgi:hypothetical protein
MQVMAKANNREPYFLQLGTGTFALIQVDKDIYDTDVVPALGLTKTEPPNTATVIKMAFKTLFRTGKAARIRATAFREVTESGETVTKSRQVPLVCAVDKLDTVGTALKDKTVKLGDQGLTWTIGSVNFG